MSKDKEIVRIDLTPEQKQLVKKEVGKDAEAVELTVSELEERITPRMYMERTDVAILAPPGPNRDGKRRDVD